MANILSLSGASAPTLRNKQVPAKAADTVDQVAAEAVADGAARKVTADADTAAAEAVADFAAPEAGSRPTSRRRTTPQPG